MPFVSPWFTAASQAFIKIPVRFEHKQLPTKCYTTCALTTLLTDCGGNLDCYIRLPLKFTLFPRVVVQSRKQWCRLNTPFSTVNVTLCPALATSFSPGSFFCSSRASLHHYSERSCCGSAKWSHACTQISWHQPGFGWPSPPLHWPLVLPPAPYL